MPTRTRSIERARPGISSAGGSSSGASAQQNHSILLGPNDVRYPFIANYTTYTSMYKQHPIVRAVIDKLAKAATANGYVFGPRNPEIVQATTLVTDPRVVTLQDTFARSRGNYLLKQTYTDLLIYGDAYWHIEPSRLGVPYQMRRVYPAFVTAILDRDTREVTSWVVRDLQGQETQFPPQEILHFLFFDPFNDTYGLSPLESLKSTVAQDLFAQQYNEAFFANSAQTGIVFNMKNASKAEVDRNREFLKKEYSGTANAHKPLVLEGDVDVSKSVASPADMQFIDGRKQLKAEILAVFDVPDTKVGGTHEGSNRSQSSENDKSFRSESIIPLQTIIEEVVNEVLLFEIFNFQDIVFAHKDVDKRDEVQQMNIFKEGMSTGIYTLNFVLGELGQPSAGPAGDMHYVSTPFGVIPVDLLYQLAEAQVAAATAGSAGPPGSGPAVGGKQPAVIPPPPTAQPKGTSAPGAPNAKPARPAAAPSSASKSPPAGGGGGAAPKRTQIITPQSTVGL